MRRRDWARVEKVPNFVPTDLFDPKVNIEVGTWYLKRALDHWAARMMPCRFALAEIQRRPHPRVKQVGQRFRPGESAGARRTAETPWISP